MFRRNNTAALVVVLTALVLTYAPAAKAAGSDGNSSASLKTLFATPGVTTRRPTAKHTGAPGASSAAGQGSTQTRSQTRDGGNGQGRSVSKLARLQTEMTMLKYEISVLKLQVQKQKLRTEVAGGGVGVESGQSYTPPKVSMVEGRLGHLTARLQFSNGSLLNVHTGSVLPDGSKVVYISADSVVIERHGRKYPLAYVGNSQSGVPILYAPWSPPAVGSAPRNNRSSVKAPGGGR